MRSKMVSLAGFICLIITTIISAFSIVKVKADDENTTILPEPIKIVDFSYSYQELKEYDSSFEVVENAAKPLLIEDEKMGQVLKLGTAVMKEHSYAEDNKYWIIDNSEYSTIKLSNPYVGREYLKEYEPYENVKTTERVSGRNNQDTVIQPKWEEGITICYWIKSPNGKNSNVIGFTSERFQMQGDDYANYLCTVKFDLEYNQLSDSDRKILNIGPSGVLPDSEFYFEYAGYDSKGNPITYMGKPIYISPQDMGEIYWANKFYEPGYYITRNGEYEETFLLNDIYEKYSTAPYLGATQTEHNPRTSVIRYGWTYGEMWLDASSSFYFVNDAVYSRQLNSNHITSYDTYIDLQAQNCFSINSWKSSRTFEEAIEKEMVAASPLTKIGQWHFVAVVIQNDWVSYYLDGDIIDVQEEYSSYGLSSLPTTFSSYIPWKRFNKGTGARFGYGVARNKVTNCAYSNYVSPTMLEWLIMDSTKMTIGGGNLYGDNYNMFAETDEILIKNVVFYDTILSDEQVKLLSTKPFMYDKENGEYYGDVNVDGEVNAEDALLILKHASRLISLNNSQTIRSDVNNNYSVNAEDALLILKYAAGIVGEL